LDGKGNFEFENIHDGFTNKDSLEHVGYDIMEMQDLFRKSLMTLKLPKAEQIKLMNQIKDIFDSHTYLT
jgi:arginine decarboxylase-like protein